MSHMEIIIYNSKHLNQDVSYGYKSNLIGIQQISLFIYEPVVIIKQVLLIETEILQ